MHKKKLDARLEIRLSPYQLQKLKNEATDKNTSVGDLVREAIDLRYKVSVNEKIKAVEDLAKFNAPVADWEEMKKEIEAGYLKK